MISKSVDKVGIKLHNFKSHVQSFSHTSHSQPRLLTSCKESQIDLMDRRIL